MTGSKQRTKHAKGKTTKKQQLKRKNPSHLHENISVVYICMKKAFDGIEELKNKTENFGTLGLAFENIIVAVYKIFTR